ncbi:MAG: hypothetical protein GXO71_07895 [Caldiserica bacterium]|nr:hypothetical protein [Caldisericota bacterium]
MQDTGFLLSPRYKPGQAGTGRNEKKEKQDVGRKHREERIWAGAHRPACLIAIYWEADRRSLQAIV